MPYIYSPDFIHQFRPITLCKNSRVFLSSTVSHMDWLWHSQKVNTHEQPSHLQVITVLQRRASTDHICIRWESLQSSFFMLSALSPNLPASYCIPGYFIKYISLVSCTISGLTNTSWDQLFYTQIGNIEIFVVPKNFWACNKKMLRTKGRNGGMMGNQVNNSHSPAVTWPV